MNQDQNLFHLNGEFTAQDKLELLSAYIKETIKFCKIKNMSLWEKNHTANSEFYEKQINDLWDQYNFVQKLRARPKDQKVLSIEASLKVNFES